MVEKHDAIFSYPPVLYAPLGVPVIAITPWHGKARTVVRRFVPQNGPVTCRGRKFEFAMQLGRCCQVPGHRIKLRPLRTQ